MYIYRYDLFISIESTSQIEIKIQKISYNLWIKDNSKYYFRYVLQAAIYTYVKLIYISEVKYL